KRQYSVKCQVSQVHSAKARINARPLFLDGISKATDNTRLKCGGDPVSQHKIQMIGYFANLFGLGFNFVGTFLLVKYSPESKTTDGWTVTADFEKELTPHLRLLPKKFTVLLFFCLSALPFNFWRRSCCNSSERPSL